MKKVNVKRISLLGLTLLGTSALIAAILPSGYTDKENKLDLCNGEITTSFGDGINYSCRTRDNIAGQPEAGNCHDTDSQAEAPLSDTTVGGITSDDEGDGVDTNTTIGDCG